MQKYAYVIHDNYIIMNIYVYFLGIVFGNYDPQWKLQRHTSMIVLRSLGYGKNVIQEKICIEANELCQSLEQKPETNIDIYDEIR